MNDDLKETKGMASLAQKQGGNWSQEADFNVDFLWKKCSLKRDILEWALNFPAIHWIGTWDILWILVENNSNRIVNLGT